MVRVRLTAYNPSSLETPLNFSTIGNLTQPINGKYVSVLSYSIPSTWIPIMVLPTDYYHFSLSYNSWSWTEALKPVSGPSAITVYEIHQLLEIMNGALIKCYDGLDTEVYTQTGLHLPAGSEAPRVIYDVITSLYSIVVNPTYYGNEETNKISMYLDTAMFAIMASMPIRSVNNIFQGYPFRWRVSVSATPENQYLTNYIKIQQESASIYQYAYARYLLITTQMPVEGEIQCSNLSQSSGSSSMNVIQSYTFPYNAGTSDIFTNSDFTAPSEPYRRCRITGKDIYNINCGVYYQPVNGSQPLPVYIGPYQSASILLEFRDD